MKERKTYYLYKDKFLSGWGRAERGSYVITEGRSVSRPEFKFLGSTEDLRKIKFGSGKGRDIELWRGIRTEHGYPKKTYKLYWVGKNKRLIRRKMR